MPYTVTYQDETGFTEWSSAVRVAVEEGVGAGRRGHGGVRGDTSAGDRRRARDRGGRPGGDQQRQEAP